MRRVVLLLAAAALVAPGPRRAGAADRVDLSGVASIAADGAEATAGGDPRAHRAYRRVGAALDDAVAHGLGRDFTGLGVAARACRDALAADADLRDSVRAALDEGAAILRARDAEVLAAAGLLVENAKRVRVQSTLSRARGEELEGRQRLAEGNDEGAAALFRRAAAGYRRAANLAERLRLSEIPRSPEWAIPIQGRAGALLSVCGDPGLDPRLYAVGARDVSGPQFLVLHPGAEEWVRVPATPAAADLWWVAVVPGDGAWASGSGGLVLRYDPATGELEDRSTGVPAVLYGVWGSGPADVWAVGGDPGTALLHWDGDAWTPVDPPAAAAGRALYKVWGSAADDVWAVGEQGTLLHFDGAAWATVESGTGESLLGVHGPSPVVAVGGGAAAVALESIGGGPFDEVHVSGVPEGSTGQAPARSLSGVFVPATGDALAVGTAGTVVRRGGDGWSALPGVPVAAKDLHSVWIDAEGNALMAGGALSSLTQGMLVSYGRRRLPSAVVARERLRGPVADLFFARCAHSGCHISPYANEALFLDTPENVRAGLVSVPSAQSPLLRVLPGRPSQSYLWHKLQGTQESVGGSGALMPELHQPGDQPLTEAELDRIRGWIVDGARDN